MQPTKVKPLANDLSFAKLSFPDLLVFQILDEDLRNLKWCQLKLKVDPPNWAVVFFGTKEVGGIMSFTHFSLDMRFEFFDLSIYCKKSMGK